MRWGGNGVIALLVPLSVTASYNYKEAVDFYSIQGGLVAARFNFVQSLERAALSNAVNLESFPRPIVELVDKFDLKRLCVAFSKGRWDYEEWGQMPVQPSSTGVEVNAQINLPPPSADNNDYDVNHVWRKLTLSLSGLFCASINLINEGNSEVPKKLAGQVIALRGQITGEAVCTENLTPWSKLLPCSTFAGLAMLLNPLRVFDSTFHSFNVNVISSTDPISKRRTYSLDQNLLVVFDLARRNGHFGWTIHQLFDRKVKRPCQIATKSHLRIMEPSPVPEGWTVVKYTDDGVGEKLESFHEINLLDVMDKDVGVIGNSPGSNTTSTNIDTNSVTAFAPTKLFVARQLSKVGQEHGGLVISWENRGEQAGLIVKHREVIPHFLNVLLTRVTLELSGKGLVTFKDYATMAIAPSKWRESPMEMEITLRIPPLSKLVLELPFEKDFLRYTDFPFDPNRGFDLPGGLATFTDPITGIAQTIITPKLLITMPTPDFTMPFNVITLTSTVIILFYGTFFNQSYRRFYRGPTVMIRLQIRVVQFINNFIKKLTRAP